MRHDKEHNNLHAQVIGSEQKQNNSAIYQCPMKCEGGKVYNAPRDCTVCGMHLVPPEVINKHAEHHYSHDHEAPSLGNGNYYCPMHPEIRQSVPGSCPKCGMDLVPEKGELTSEEEIAYKMMYFSIG